MPIDCIRAVVDAEFQHEIETDARNCVHPQNRILALLLELRTIVHLDDRGTKEYDFRFPFDHEDTR